MDLPAEILIHNALLGLKGGKGKLVRVSSQGFYEVKIAFGKKTHRVLLPVDETVVIFREPEAEWEPGVEVER